MIAFPEVRLRETAQRWGNLLTKIVWPLLFSYLSNQWVGAPCSVFALKLIEEFKDFYEQWKLKSGDLKKHSPLE